MALLLWRLDCNWVADLAVFSLALLLVYLPIKRNYQTLFSAYYNWTALWISNLFSKMSKNLSSLLQIGYPLFQEFYLYKFIKITLGFSLAPFWGCSCSPSWAPACTVSVGFVLAPAWSPPCTWAPRQAGTTVWGSAWPLWCRWPLGFWRTPPWGCAWGPA